MTSETLVCTAVQSVKTASLGGVPHPRSLFSQPPSAQEQMENNMRIPLIRKRLYELADEHGIEELRKLADASYRRAPVRQAPRTAKARLTDEQKRHIDQLADTFIHMPLRDIAQRVGSDQGRVSEYLSRKARASA